MSDITRIVTNTRRGRAVVYNGLVFIGGQVADDRSQDIRGQTEQVLAKIERILTEAGSHKARLLSAQIWLKDIGGDFVGMNEVWDAWIGPDIAPSRATVQCELGAPGALIEIVVTAATKQ
jgi:enamine deaminase RidA (YjgF/YER057c/UK114 family)